MFLRNMRNLFLVLGIPSLLVFVYANFIQEPRADKDPLAFVGSGDPDMAAARAHGQATLTSDFLPHLRASAPDEDHFGIKFRLEPRHVSGPKDKDQFALAGDESDEFIWANELVLTSDGQALTGRIDDTPRSKGYVRGQPVTIPLDDVVDWGYTKNGVMQGNFTTKFLLAHMPADEAAQARRVLGWR